jgi:hypothetical protein
MTTIAPTPKAEATIRSWIDTNLVDEMNELEVIESLAFNISEGLARANSTCIKAVKSVHLNELHLLSLNYSKVHAIVKVNSKVSLNVSWDDYLTSEEVRQIVGDSEEFTFISLDTDSDFTLKIEFELLSEPPMVASHKVLSIEGEYGTFNFTP